jgi:hypothetical protein
MSLTRRYGFKPTRVIVRGTHATILFENQKGEASRYVSQLKPAMKQMGVPENAMKSREVSHPAEAGLPAEDVGVVEIDFSRMLERASRPGAKDTMAQPKFKVGDKVRNTHGDVIGIVAQMWTDNNSEPVYRLVDESKLGIGQFKERHLLRASRPGVKDTMAVEDRFYFGKERFAENVTYTVASFIGSQPVGQRSVKSLEEAKTLAKQMLASAKGSAKGQPVVVDVYPVVNYEPKDSILALRA